VWAQRCHYLRRGASCPRRDADGLGWLPSLEPVAGSSQESSPSCEPRSGGYQVADKDGRLVRLDRAGAAAGPGKAGRLVMLPRPHALALPQAVKFALQPGAEHRLHEDQPGTALRDRPLEPCCNLRFQHIARGARWHDQRRQAADSIAPPGAVVPGWSSVRCSSSNGIPAGRVRHRKLYQRAVTRPPSGQVRPESAIASYTSAAMSRQNWSVRLTEPPGHRAVGGLPSAPDTQNGSRLGDRNTVSRSSVSTRCAPSPSARSAQSAAWVARWRYQVTRVIRGTATEVIRLPPSHERRGLAAPSGRRALPS
jgi:hypothetical protein